MHKTHEKKVRQPNVEGSTCTAMCVFEDANNSWCFEGTQPMMTAGWTWYQNVDTTYWNVQFQPYIET